MHLDIRLVGSQGNQWARAPLARELVVGSYCMAEEEEFVEGG